ncbi:MAG: hypothetical protein CR996_00275 [Draconibacterium sp.]|nr:MAG: hypothetical protein CR996_00275 [Draconibacterium sp.]PIF06466.1 MAG: hypothetical protein CSA36_01455 [Draconibacterium sp.]
MKKIFFALTLIMLVLASYSQNTNGDNLFDDSFLHEFRFESVDTNKFINTKKYQQLKMIVDGNIVDSIGFKRKGNISQYSDPNKKAIKIKTNKYVKGKKYDGIKEFTLHINYQDPTMMREKLTYDICAEMGLFSLRAAFAKVYINDDYWGLYTIVEGKDEIYKQVFDNKDMDVIESLDLGDMCYISDNPTDYDYDNNSSELPTYQLENGDPATAWVRFATMIDKANNTPNNTYVDTVSKYLNLEDFFKYQAINVYLMNMDSYISFKGNQIYVYDTVANLWQIIPWDFNASFGLWNTNNYSPSTYEMIPNAISNGCIAGKLNEIPELKEYYLNAMCQLNDIVGDTTNYSSKIDTWKAQIQQAVYEDTRKHITNTDFDNSLEHGYLNLFEENIPALKTFIKERLAVVTQGLEDENYDCATGVQDQTQSDNILICPNPTSDIINIQWPNNQNSNYTIKIINTFGQVVYTSYNESVINIEFLSRGVYVVMINNQNFNYTKKIIKQ